MIAVVIQQQIGNSVWTPVQVVGPFHSQEAAERWTMTQRTSRDSICFQYIQIEPPIVDPIVRSVVVQFQRRSELGRQKYGTDLTREDLSPAQWVQHLQEELMDAINYLEVLKSKFNTP